MAYPPMVNAPHRSSLWWLGLSLLTLVLDQLTKFWASQVLTYQEPYSIIPFLNFTLVHNTGAAFSFLAEAGGWQRYFLTALAVIVSLIMVVWLSRLSANQKWLAATIALILGGALGNLIDRVLYGYVIDFIDIYYQAWHFPAFNIADSAITVGAVMLLIDALWLNRTQQAPFSS
ncbi:signal peptidase II [Beggiatoa leptomitoformis]|uniref:Lipoprotein signal peptidase n=1 Tax=Beggiatoa leptomitoformis TaxID=288004 RepID=A0A2N9YJL1_9GAMM|nr:signal peptidase II [Beggiatoa leptomitoformis]ALG69426.2 lipoprotein signal peptidase [Beggiatoa leptomitoformis]AUI70653.2 lipoprotein signal peptidase [Beggiatoa leptomitoformis]